MLQVSPTIRNSRVNIQSSTKCADDDVDVECCTAAADCCSEEDGPKTIQKTNFTAHYCVCVWDKIKNPLLQPNALFTLMYSTYQVFRTEVCNLEDNVRFHCTLCAASHFLPCLDCSERARVVFLFFFSFFLSRSNFFPPTDAAITLNTAQYFTLDQNIKANLAPALIVSLTTHSKQSNTSLFLLIIISVHTKGWFFFVSPSAK